MGRLVWLAVWVGAVGCAPSGAEDEAPGPVPAEEEVAPIARCLGDLVLLDEEVPGPGRLHALAADEQGRIAVATDEGVWLREPGGRWQAVGPEGEALVVALGEGRVAWGDGDGRAGVADAVEEVQWALGEEASRAVALEPGGTRLAWASAAYAGEARIQDTAADAVSGPYDTLLWQVHQLHWAGPDRLLALGDWYGLPRVELWTVGEPEVDGDGPPGWTVNGPAGTFRDLAWLGDEELVVVGRNYLEDGGLLVRVRLADLAQGLWAELEPAWQVRTEVHTPVAVEVWDDAVLTVGAEGALMRLRASDGREEERLELDEALVGLARVGEVLWVAGEQGSVWRVGCG